MGALTTAEGPARVHCQDCDRSQSIPAEADDDILVLLVRRFLSVHDRCCFTVTLDVPRSPDRLTPSLQL